MSDHHFVNAKAPVIVFAQPIQYQSNPEASAGHTYAANKRSIVQINQLRQFLNDSVQHIEHTGHGVLRIQLMIRLHGGHQVNA